MDALPPFITNFWQIWLAAVSVAAALFIDRTQKNAKVTKIFIVLFSLGGLYLLGDLLYVKITERSSVCDLSETVSCSAVNASEFSEILGIPIGIFGIGFFLLAIFLALNRGKHAKNEAVLVGTHQDNMALLVLAGILAVIPAVYLSIIEYFVIDIICPFCEASKVLMFGIVALALPAARRSELFTKKAVIVLTLIALQGSVFVYLVQQRTAGIGKDYTEFVQCLMEEENVQMYGSFKCGSCAQQRRILGEDIFSAFPLEIECHPEGENPQLALCAEKGVEKTPTWIKEDDEGNIEMLVEGFQPPKKLAELFGCQDALPQ